MRQWTDVANLVLGIWLVLSPMILSYRVETIPAANTSIVGAIIAVMAAATLIAFHEWEEWVNVVLAIWLIVSPFLLALRRPAKRIVEPGRPRRAGRRPGTRLGDCLSQAGSRRLSARRRNPQ